MPGAARHIFLQEHQTTLLSRASLGDKEGARLWRHYDRACSILQVQFPSPQTDDRWALTPRGWVGHIPVSPDVALHLQPKVTVGRLFTLLAWVHDLTPLLPGDLVAGATVADVYAQLAALLAQGVLRRARRGFYREPAVYRERLPYLRGRPDVSASMHRPAAGLPASLYEAPATDIPDNQILAATLRQIAHSGICSGPAQALVARARRVLRGVATPVPARPRGHYHRLNEEYRGLHALCHLFRTHRGPNHGSGHAPQPPFLVHMPRLFEQFLATWLRARLPAPWRLRAQETIAVEGNAGRVRFSADLVLYGGAGQAQAILDAKYKADAAPQAADIAQVTAYAAARGCSQAFLVYPHPPAQPLDVMVGNVRVRALTFALAGDLEAAGATFLSSLLGAPVAATPSR